ncbi:MAG: flagellar basal body P-ring formation protein FlgA [Alphaproteobacteria bacterium]|nr:flagellar basal body P-ring formation protein FlgA [Alphaproteobacteria bacterium]
MSYARITLVGIKTGLRLLVLALALTVGVAFIVAGGQAALASSVYLKNSSIVTGNHITLGDIFGGLEEEADKVLGPAPQPGRDMVLNARTLLRIAIALDLPWRPAGSGDHVVLTRAATILGSAELQALVEDELRREQNLSGRFEIEFASTDNAMVLPHDVAATAEITALTYSPQRDWFQATIAAPSADNPVAVRQLTGAVRRIVEVPVLKDNLRNGDVIAASDIEWIDLYAKDLQHDYYLDAEQIVGMTPRRMVVSGKPIRDMELEAPKIVERGDTVTIVFEQGPMRLTAEGRALRDGAKGDFIRVVNSNSSQSIEGTVIAPRTIVVR